MGHINKNINSKPVQIVERIRDFGILLHRILSFNAQGGNVSKIDIYHLRTVAFLKKYIDDSSMKKPSVTE